MTAALTVASRPATSAIARAVVSSLPQSFALSDADIADVVVIGGATGWAGEASALVAAGARRVVVIDPRADASSAVIELAEAVDASGAIVALSESFAGNAGLVEAAGSFASSDVVTVTGYVAGDVSGAVLEHLRIARVLGLSGLTIVDAQSTGRSSLVTARAGRGETSVLVRSVVTVTSGVPTHHVVRGYSFDGAVTATVFDSDTARPALVTVNSSAGAALLPTTYESAHRTTWRALVDAPATSAHLRSFADDVDTAGAIVGA